MFTRKDYMNKACTHREYYGQFVNDGVIRLVLHRIGRKAILGSTDPHFNDIPLHRWDALCGFDGRPYSGGTFTGGAVYPLVAAKFKELGQHVSPSDLLCVLKEAARQIKEDHDV